MAGVLRAVSSARPPSSIAWLVRPLPLPPRDPDCGCSALPEIVSGNVLWLLALLHGRWASPAGQPVVRGGVHQGGALPGTRLGSWLARRAAPPRRHVRRDLPGCCLLSSYALVILGMACLCWDFPSTTPAASLTEASVARRRSSPPCWVRLAAPRVTGRVRRPHRPPSIAVSDDWPPARRAGHLRDARRHPPACGPARGDRPSCGDASADREPAPPRLSPRSPRSSPRRPTSPGSPR